MAQRQDLAEIGLDGFSILELIRTGGSPLSQQEQHQQRQFQFQRKSQPQPYNSYWRTKVAVPLIKQSAANIDCDQAARLFGGMVIRDYGKKSAPARKAY